MKNKLGFDWLLLRLLCGGVLLPVCSYADSDAVVNSSISSLEQATHLAQSFWGNREFSRVLGAQQATLTLTRVGEKSQLTDNGSLTLLLSANTRGQRLHSWALRQGGAVDLDYDFSGTVNILGLHKQLLNSADIGQSIGTGVHGGYVAAGVRLNLSMGPLYPDSSIFWRYSLAAGPGELYYRGTAQFDGTQAVATAQSVGGRGQVMLWLENKWELSINRWELVFNTQYMTGAAQQGLHTSYIVFGLGVERSWSF